MLGIFIKKLFQETITSVSVRWIMSNKLYSIVSKVMSVPEWEIGDQSGPESIKVWDSLNLYMLIEDIEAEFNVKFTMEEILEIKNVGHFKKLLANHGCELNE